MNYRERTEKERLLKELPPNRHRCGVCSNKPPCEGGGAKNDYSRTGRTES